jgi:glycosyltransferase involved in cell wall biosynthesis
MPLAQGAVELQLQPRLTVVICSNRPAMVERYWRDVLATIKDGDVLCVVLDVETTAEVRCLAETLTLAGVRCVLNHHNLGLARCRNLAIDQCDTDLLIFVDDDVAVPRATIAAIRAAFATGASIIGVRIRGPEAILRLPWFLSDAQLHYLAIHTDGTLSTWGACMGLDVRHIRVNGLAFRDELGRRGNELASGDDTTFLREMRALDAPEVFLADHHVHHNVPAERLRMTYILRRAYWQGRSEYRRRSAWQGARKEWRRNRVGSRRQPLRLLLALTYVACVVLGIAREAAAHMFRALTQYPRSSRLRP